MFRLVVVMLDFYVFVRSIYQYFYGSFLGAGENHIIPKVLHAFEITLMGMGKIDQNQITKKKSLHHHQEEW